MVDFLYGEPLSDRSLVDDLQADLGVRFPASYVSIVLQHDGASLEPATCIVVDPRDGTKTPIACNQLLPFDGGDDAFTMRAANTGGTDGLPTGIVVFGLEAGGIMFGFDYRETAEEGPVPVVVLDFERPDDEMIVQVAADFDDFLGSLVPDEEADPSP